MIVIAIILLVIGVINLFVTSDTLMALTFITTGLLIFLNRAIYMPSGKVVLGTFVTGVCLSTHVDSYVYKILGDSSYEYGFSEGLNIIWTSIFTSYPVGYEELYGSRRFFLIALAITIIFIIIDLVKGVDLTPTKTTGKTPSRKSYSTVNEDEDYFYKHLATIRKGFNPTTQVNGNEYDTAQEVLAQYCGKKIYKGGSTDVFQFAYDEACKYPIIEYVGYDPKYQNVTGGSVYRVTNKNLHEYIMECKEFYAKTQLW